jgi:hypothetical protein
MAAAKSVTSTGVQYHVTDAANNHVTLGQSVSNTKVVMTIGNSLDGPATLTQQNAIDLLTAFTAFANTGIVT